MVTAEMKNRGVSGGEGGQRMTALAGSSDGQLLFAGTDVAGMWRSQNGGASWEMIYGGLFAKGIFAVAVDPVNKNRVIAYGGAPSQDVSAIRGNMFNGLYLSEDGGTTWEFVLQQKGATLKLGFTESIAFDPSSYDVNSGRCMVAYWSRPWDLQDMPATSAPFYTGENVKTFAADEYDNTVVNYTADRKCLWKTTDGGESWSPVCDGMTDGIVKVHPTDGTVYLSNLSGFFRSTDGGNTFDHILSGRMIYGLDVISTRPDNVYINDVDGLMVSTDSGMTFTSVLSSSFPDSYDITNNPDKISPDGIVRSLKVSPVNPNNMVIAYHSRYYNYSSRKYYTKNGGLTWQLSGNDTRNDFFKANIRDTCFLWSPTNENKLWAFGGDWVTSSSTGGQTYIWDYNGGSAVFMDGRALFNVYNPDLFYYGAQDFHGALTKNGGETWEHMWKWTRATGVSGTGQGYGSVYGAYAVDEKTMLAIASDGLWNGNRNIYMSYDAGETWTKKRVTVTKNNGQKWAEMCYQSPKNPNVIFAGNFRSTDKGVTWAEMTGGVNLVYCHNPYEKKELYGSDDGGYIVTSYDDGATWQRIVKAEMPEGITGGQISDMAYDGVSKIIYYVSGTSKSRSLYKLKNGITQNLTSRLVTSKLGMAVQLVAVDPRYPNVVYAGGNRSAFVQANAVWRSTDGGETFYVLTANGCDDSVVKTGQAGGIQPYDMLVHPKTGELWVSNGCRGWTKIAPPYTENSDDKNKIVQIN